MENTIWSNSFVQVFLGQKGISLAKNVFFIDVVVLNTRIGKYRFAIVRVYRPFVHWISQFVTFHLI